jgi:hypothetical protein
MTIKKLHKYSPPWKESRPIYVEAVPWSEKKISSWWYWIVEAIKANILQNLWDNDVLNKDTKQKEITLVRKRMKKRLTPKEEERQLYIHYLLKKIGINTFTTFYSDGESFYSTPLNTEENIALSCNNDAPILYWATWEKKDIPLSFEIKNIYEICDQIIDIAIKASKVWLKIERDALFFNVNKSTIDNKRDIYIKSIWVYDFDICNISNATNTFAAINIINLESSITEFIQSYTTKENQWWYIQTIKSKLSLILTSDEIYCSDGIHSIENRKPENWEILHKKIILVNNKFTQEQVQHFCKIPGLTVDLTNWDQTIKNTIIDIIGNLIDTWEKCSYVKLESIGGNWDFGNLTSAKWLTSLQSIGGNWYFKNLTSAEWLTSLQSIGGNWDFGNLINAEWLTSLQSIGGDGYLRNLTSAEWLTSLQSIGRDWYLRNLTSAEWLTSLQSIGGNWDFGNLTSAKWLTSLQSIGGNWNFKNLTSAEWLKSLQSIGGNWDFGNLTSAKWLTSLQSIGGNWNFKNLTSAEWLTSLQSIGGNWNFKNLTSAEWIQADMRWIFYISHLLDYTTLDPNKITIGNIKYTNKQWMKILFDTISIYKQYYEQSKKS